MKCGRYPASFVHKPRPVGTGRVLRHFRSAGCNLFQQDQLQRWNQRPQLHHPQSRVLLKSLHVRDQGVLAEIVAAGGEISRGQGHHAGSYGAVRRANVRKLADQLEAFLRSPELGMQKAKVVIQPAKVVSHRILGRRPVQMS